MAPPLSRSLGRDNLGLALRSVQPHNRLAVRSLTVLSTPRSSVAVSSPSPAVSSTFAAASATSAVVSSTSAVVSATSAPSKAPPVGVSLPPHGAAALIGIVVVLCLCVFGFAVWRIWVWRSNGGKKSASHKFPGNSSMKTSPGSDVKRSASQTTVVDITHPTDIKYLPKVVYEAPPNATKDLPPIIAVTAAQPLKISPPPIYVELSAPVLSPRTASRLPSPRPVSSAKLPRLVVVKFTFTPTLHDELQIHEGEILRLLEEYEDEWCLVQRPGPADAEKGVIPRFCVVDKPTLLSSRKSKRIPRLSLAQKI